MAGKHYPQPFSGDATAEEVQLANDEAVKEEHVTPKQCSDDEKRSGSRQTESHHAVTTQDIDDTTVFYNLNKDNVSPLTPEIEARIVRKNFWFLLAQTWWIAFAIHLDKSTLSQASTMGIFKDVSMTKSEYNDLFVVFYTGYLIALWPGAWLSQKIGQKHLITGSLFLWALLLGMHPLAQTGKQLIALRFLLGIVSHHQIHHHIFADTTKPQTESQIVPSTLSYIRPFPPEEEPVGSTPLVGLRQFCERAFDNGGLQAHRRRQRRCSRRRHIVLEVAPYHLRCHYIRHICAASSLPTKHSG